jgi:hypothetical protein
MARDQQGIPVDYSDIHSLEVWIYNHIAVRLFSNDLSARVVGEVAERLAPHVQAMVRGALASRDEGPVRLGELVSGELVLMRRAIGILTDLQRLEREVGAILDAFASGDERAHVAELRLREAIALRNGKHGEASILHNAALHLAGELDALRIKERWREEDASAPTSPAPGARTIDAVLRGAEKAASHRDSCEIRVGRKCTCDGIRDLVQKIKD